MCIRDGSNAVVYGLTAGIYSEEQAEIDQFLDQIHTGVLYVNRRAGATTAAWPGAQPFGGWKGSGSTGTPALGPYYVGLFGREPSPPLRGRARLLHTSGPAAAPRPVLVAGQCHRRRRTALQRHRRRRRGRRAGRRRGRDVRDARARVRVRGAGGEGGGGGGGGGGSRGEATGAVEHGERHRR